MAMTKWAIRKKIWGTKMVKNISLSDKICSIFTFPFLIWVGLFAL